jgi:hypothetical protein
VRALVFSPLFAVGFGACPAPVVPPTQLPPVDMSARIADGAPPADGSDAPEVRDLLPSGMPASVVVVDLGLVGLKDGVSGDILVDTVDLGAMTILVYGHESTTVILERVVDPTGAVVVSDVPPTDLASDHVRFARGFPAQVFSTNRVLGSDVSGSFLLPNTPAVPPIDGTWTLRVSAWTVDLLADPPMRTPVDRPVRVVIVARGADGGRGRLDLNLHFAGDQLDAAGAASDALVQGALDVVREAYGAVGIDVGNVRYLDAVRGFQIVELEEGSCQPGGLEDLVSSLRGTDGAAGVELFFVDGFSCFIGAGVDIGSGIGGLSAGVPGPPWVRGSRHAGIAVSTSFAGDEGLSLGVVMAHELGHFLGLYHTREQTFFNAPAVFDEIEDTPDGDENLMYFAASDDVSLSNGQGAVLRTSPFVVAE